MSDGSTIEWLSWPGYRPASWNPARDCIGQVRLYEANLLLPLKWRAPRCTFVNSTSDLFHERLPDEAIDRVFAVMALCPQHRFIVLTKRAERMREYIAGPFNGDGVCARIADATWEFAPSRANPLALVEVPIGPLLTNGEPEFGWRRMMRVDAWPLPNVVLGVSVEDRSTMHRIDDLRATPAACRMISFEPLLEDLGQIDLTGISWAVTGGESGPGARPAHPAWFRAVRDQCLAAGVAYFHKQNGEWTSFDDGGLFRVGKHRAGRLLDGRTHDEFPEMANK